VLRSSNLCICVNPRRRKKIKKASVLPNFFSLRSMEETDLVHVLEIEKLSFPNPWREMTFMGEMYNKPISFSFVIVHKSQRKIIGYIIFWYIKNRAQINNIAIHPDFRRMGIAETVIRQTLDQVRVAGAEYVTLEVRPSNMAARFLYNKLGFDVLATKENYYNDPREDALVMGIYLG